MKSSKWQKDGGKWQIVAVTALLAVSPSLFTTLVFGDAPKISGFIDTTYSYDFNSPASRRTAMRTFNSRTDTFLLNAAQVNIEGSKDGIGYYAELAFGSDPSVYRNTGAGAASVSGNEVDVQEAFVTYKCPITAVHLKAGKFVTLQGIEVIESHANPTVTRGHLFGFAEPFTHVGALVGYEFPKFLDIWLGVVNGWDVDTDNNIGKTFVWKLGVKVNEMFWGSISGTRGTEQTRAVTNLLGSIQRTSFDTVWYLKPMDMLTLAWQINAGEEERLSANPVNAGGAAHWYGFGLQPKIDFTKMFSLGARYEWFSDLDGARTGVRHVAQTITLTPGVNLTENLMFRVDLRHDWSAFDRTANQGVYEASDGVFSRSDASSIATEFVYKF